MLQSSRKRAYASLLALLCSIIMLNMAMAQFTYVRERIRASHAQRDGLNRKMFRAHGSTALWGLSEDLISSGLVSGVVLWEGVSIDVRRYETIGDLHLLETLEAEADDHPEWGRLMSRRITTHGKTFYLFGEKE